MEDEALGPLLCKGSKAYRRHESQASNAKRLVRVKCDTSMRQAIAELIGPPLMRRHKDKNYT